MTKEEYLDFGLRYKGCGVLFPLYEKLNRFEKRWFTAIQKDVADPEKEIAELKEQNRSYEQLLETGSVTLMKDRLKNYKQLAKAKEIIKDLYFIIQSRIEYKDNIPLNDSMSRAEQFIKEIEK